MTEHWTKLILSYARHRRLFLVRVEDAEVAGNDWDEILRNGQINSALSRLGSRALMLRWGCSGRLLPSHLAYIMEGMVAGSTAVYEPAGQTRSVLLYWRTPEEWAEVLHSWVRSSALQHRKDTSSCRDRRTPPGN